MTFNGFHHIGLASADAEKSLEFYTRGLGGKQVHSFPMGGNGPLIYLVDLGGNAVVEIIPKDIGGEESDQRWLHIAVATDDVDGAHAMALKAGAENRTSPQDCDLGGMAVRNSFVLGPDREVIEFFHVK